MLKTAECSNLCASDFSSDVWVKHFRIFPRGNQDSAMCGRGHFKEIFRFVSNFGYLRLLISMADKILVDPEII